MTRMIFVNLPVADVARATAFYEAIGFVKNDAFSNEQASAMGWSDQISVMLLDHAFFKSFLPADRAIGDAHRTAQALMCLTFDNREAVDAIADAAGAAGGTTDVREPQDLGFMYSRAFADPDGHIYEPMWMDVQAATSAMTPEAASA